MAGRERAFFSCPEETLTSLAPMLLLEAVVKLAVHRQTFLELSLLFVAEQQKRSLRQRDWWDKTAHHLCALITKSNS